MINKIKRKLYVRAMFKAIDLARTCPGYHEEVRRKTIGLRVIKRFEKVNNTRFDPFDTTHTAVVTSLGAFEDFFASPVVKNFRRKR